MCRLSSLLPVHTQWQLRETLGGGVLLTCMMDDQSTEDNVNAIRDVACIMSAQQFSCFAFALYVRITLISNQQ